MHEAGDAPNASSVIGYVMTGRRGLTKTTDYETSFWCAGGWGFLREEVWRNEAREVVRYNLAFIVPHLVRADNGRILGYDNAHGIHERHMQGVVEPVIYTSYLATAERFYQEVRLLRERL
jgi:hypothetical protein